MKDYRKAHNLSVMELAGKAGLSRQSVYDIEAGNQNLEADTFESLIAACSVTPEQWEKGDGLEIKPKDRRQKQLRALLQLILDSQNEELIHSVRSILDTFADRVIEQKSRTARKEQTDQEKDNIAPKEKKKRKRPPNDEVAG